MTEFSSAHVPIPFTLGFRPSTGPADQIDFWVIEDNQEYRTVLEGWLNLEPGLSCTGSFGDAESALEELKITPSTPRVVLVDILLPGISGLATIRRLKELVPNLFVICLTIREEDFLMAIFEGADGYLCKTTTSIPDVAKAMKTVVSGGKPFDPYLMVRLLELVRKKEAALLAYNLSPAETKVLEMLDQGMALDAISNTLHRSLHTIASHLKAIRRKLGVHSIRELHVKIKREKLL